MIESKDITENTAIIGVIAFFFIAAGVIAAVVIFKKYRNRHKSKSRTEISSLQSEYSSGFIKSQKEYFKDLFKKKKKNKPSSPIVEGNKKKKSGFIKSQKEAFKDLLRKIIKKNKPSSPIVEGNKKEKNQTAQNNVNNSNPSDEDLKYNSDSNVSTEYLNEAVHSLQHADDPDLAIGLLKESEYQFLDKLHSFQLYKFNEKLEFASKMEAIKNFIFGNYNHKSEEDFDELINQIKDFLLYIGKQRKTTIENCQDYLKYFQDYLKSLEENKDESDDIEAKNRDMQKSNEELLEKNRDMQKSNEELLALKELIPNHEKYRILRKVKLQNVLAEYGITFDEIKSTFNEIESNSAIKDKVQKIKIEKQKIFRRILKILDIDYFEEISTQNDDEHHYFNATNLGFFNYFYQIYGEEIERAKDIYKKEFPKKEKKFYNLYDNIIPFSYNRFHLEDRIEYINASPINDSYDSLKEPDFIATQCPINIIKDENSNRYFVENNEDRAERFIRMVWERKINCVISLGDESSIIKKNDLRDILKINQIQNEKIGDFIVKFENDEKVSVKMNYSVNVYVKRIFTVSKIHNNDRAGNSSPKNPIKVTNFYFNSWEDHGLPSEKIFTEFILDMHRETYGKKKVCVHCSAGVGRTGVTILCLQMLRKIYENKAENIDVGKMFLNLRNQRMQMVQTPEQLAFCYLMKEVFTSNLSKLDRKNSHRKSEMSGFVSDSEISLKTNSEQNFANLENSLI